MTPPDVVVTGLGATTPLGGDATSTWDALRSGKSAVVALTEEWVDRFDLPVRIAAKLAVEPADVLQRVEARRWDRCEQVAVIAAREAWQHAGAPEVEPERLAVVIGTGIGGALTLLGQDDLLENAGMRKVSPLTIPMLMPNGPAAHVGLDLGARGGVHAPVAACASGAEALAIAWRMLRAGEVDVVVAGGAEACILPITLAGFAQMRAMSTRNDEPERASRPFDIPRDGFVLGEGSGVMVLERAEFAAARGAFVHGRLAGVGTSSDGHHITAPKGALGHLLGAAGAIEGMACLLAVRDGVVPPTLNLEDPDPGVQLDVVVGSAREVELHAAVNDSFGFGGHNVSLAFTSA